MKNENDRDRDERSKLDPAALMRRVRLIRVITGRFVDSMLCGEYQSVFRGHGVEFDEVREYEPGDDVRLIDWNVTARVGRLFVKRFREERELTLMFVVDTSGSQGFGSSDRSKAEVAAELTCLLALSAIRNQDRVGLVLFSDRVEKSLPPRKGRTAVARLVRDVLAARSEGRGTDIAAALRFLNNVQKRRAVVFLISDFMDDRYERELRITAGRHDLICCPVEDPRESALLRAGLLEVENPETGCGFIMDTASRAVRRRFAERARRERDALTATFRSLRIDTIPLSTTKPFLNDVRRLFRLRRKRAAHG